MRFCIHTSVLAAGLLSTSPARAEQPDPGVAVLVGAATIVAGFAAGGTMLAAHGDDPRVNGTAWLGVETGFTLAPLLAHGVVGEWGRGAAFAALPAATTLGTIPIFVNDPSAEEHGYLWEQDLLWGFFVTGLAAATVGVIDAAYASSRWVRVAPMVAPGHAGLVVGGVL